MKTNFHFNALDDFSGSYEVYKYIGILSQPQTIVTVFRLVFCNEVPLLIRFVRVRIPLVRVHRSVSFHWFALTLYTDATRRYPCNTDVIRCCSAPIVIRSVESSYCFSLSHLRAIFWVILSLRLNPHCSWVFNFMDLPLSFKNLTAYFPSHLALYTGNQPKSRRVILFFPYWWISVSIVFVSRMSFLLSSP